MVVHFLSVRAARDIAALPKSDWQWFTELCISKEWREKERSPAIKAIIIPDYFHQCLNPDKWKEAAEIDAASAPNSDTHQRLIRWVATAQDCLDSLPDDCPVRDRAE
jgi:hypothetical protein